MAVLGSLEPISGPKEGSTYLLWLWLWLLVACGPVASRGLGYVGRDLSDMRLHFVADWRAIFWHLGHPEV